MQTFLRISLSIVLIALYSPSHAQDVAVSEQPTGTASINDWTDLIDEDLTHWEKWIGVPHSSVAGLPEGTYQSDDVHKGKPLGLNNDLKNVFTIQKDGEDLLLHVTGEIYGGLTTKESFQNFHLQMKHRWGDKKWPPRANTIRDSGVLYHCYGDHGSFWKVWKSCVEYQVQEKDYGDLFLLAGPKATSRASGGGKKKKFDPEADYAKRGNIAASSEPDLPNGQWNTIDIYVVGDAAIHVCNGVVWTRGKFSFNRRPPNVTTKKFAFVQLTNSQQSLRKLLTCKRNNYAQVNYGSCNSFSYSPATS